MATALRARCVPGRAAVALHPQGARMSTTPRLPCRSRSSQHAKRTSPLKLYRRNISTSAAAQPTTTTATTETADAIKLEVAVPLRDAKQGMQLRLVKEGKGQAIEISAVASGSAAEQMGVQVGQRIRAIMDPVRPGEMLKLNDRPSLRFVLDVINMTLRDEVVMQLDPSYVTPAAASVSLQSADDDAAPAGASATDGAPAPTTSIAAQLEARYAALAAAGAISSAAELTIPLVKQQAAAAPPPAAAPGQATVSSGQDGSMYVSLAQAQAPGQAPKVDPRKMTDVQKRVKRRKDYLDQVAERNDAPFFAGLLAAFLLPAAVILGVAYSSGYLDRLYSNTLTIGLLM